MPTMVLNIQNTGRLHLHYLNKNLVTFHLFFELLLSSFLFAPSFMNNSFFPSILFFFFDSSVSQLLLSVSVKMADFIFFLLFAILTFFSFRIRQLWLVVLKLRKALG